MSPGLFLKVAIVQLVAVAALSAVLALTLPTDFFEDWGWLSGPLAWLACAGLTASTLRLPARQVLLGAVLAGMPSVLAVVLGLHWLGAVVAVALFAAWCARLPERGAAAWSG